MESLDAILNMQVQNHIETYWQPCEITSFYQKKVDINVWNVLLSITLCGISLRKGEAIISLVHKSETH